MRTRCRSPPDSAENGRAARCTAPTRSKASAAMSRSSAPRRWKVPRCGVRPNMTVSATVNGISPLLSCTTTASRRASSGRLKPDSG